MKTFRIRSTSDLPEVAEAILDARAGRTVIAFRGGMGAGKTTLIRAVCDRLGVTDTVTSPTFAIVNEYRGDGTPPVYHFDFYRIDRIEEAFDFGYEEYFFQRKPLLGRVAREDREPAPGRCDERAHRRARRR